ncbi:hypothetical protein ACR8AL_07495 [Clavibacter sepedonicus]|uniref:Uncharacterized protein n=1 Tax=Clavibacter sepedonicus TaxID=31964 RepID=B0RJG0_CLASE|nr:MULTISPECIES: hypothetical protein [Clavibacter]MBD5382461.1 hypothetical protein [Clavibacter sp.]OQJ45314.1 hypothetical protein B5P19_15640 [Clavibacter sepedonicus]OQJ51007.1 hypothetical protein B5P20_16275 [Clavibacter sepedonicus]UUK67213.1 hypothetical protein LRE50_15760 [Clavibacter sepedonicus]CAQ03350.1 hypothetical protein pCSL0107 [Clavibacter sepedonicus]
MAPGQASPAPDAVEESTSTPTPTPQEELLGYAEIAQMMNVKVATVWNYAVRHDHFPQPVTPAGQRAPRFRKSDVDAYIAARNAHAVGAPGRPVLTMDVGERVDPTVGGRASAAIRARLAVAGAPGHKDVAEALGIRKPALKARLRRETRWKVAELERVASLLGTTVDELTRGTDA